MTIKIYGLVDGARVRVLVVDATGVPRAVGLGAINKHGQEDEE